MNDYQKSIDWQRRTKSVQGISYKQLIQILLSVCIYFLSFLWCSLTRLLLKMPPFLSFLSIFYLSVFHSLHLPVYLSFSLSQLYVYIFYFCISLLCLSIFWHLAMSCSLLSLMYLPIFYIVNIVSETMSFCLSFSPSPRISLSPPLSEVTRRRQIKLGCVLVAEDRLNWDVCLFLSNIFIRA